MTLEQLERHIELTGYLLTNEEMSFWRFIRIKPEKWAFPGYPEKVEFYVVAIFGHRIAYYNNFEEGFNISTYKEYGKPDGAGANQNDFHDFIKSIYSSIKQGTF